jgi:hypothetical protein
MTSVAGKKAQRALEEAEAEKKAKGEQEKKEKAAEKKANKAQAAAQKAADEEKAAAKAVEAKSKRDAKKAEKIAAEAAAAEAELAKEDDEDSEEAEGSEADLAPSTGALQAANREAELAAEILATEKRENKLEKEMEKKVRRARELEKGWKTDANDLASSAAASAAASATGTDDDEEESATKPTRPLGSSKRPRTSNCSVSTTEGEERAGVAPGQGVPLTQIVPSTAGVPLTQIVPSTAGVVVTPDEVAKGKFYSWMQYRINMPVSTPEAKELQKRCSSVYKARCMFCVIHMYVYMHRFVCFWTVLLIAI